MTLSLEAEAISEPSNSLPLEEGRHKVLRGAVIYGANSSGKSNLLGAMECMRNMVLGSAKQSSAEPLPVQAFLLSSETGGKPSFFEVVFLLDGLKYRYGFEADQKRIHSEWLFVAKVAAEKQLFLREGDQIDVGNTFKEGKKLESKTRQNALFLSVVDQFAGETAGNLINWFQSTFKVISGLRSEKFEAVTVGMLNDEEHSNRLADFFKKLDLGFTDIKVNLKPFDSGDLPEELPTEIRDKIIEELKDKHKYSVHTRHSIYGKDNAPTGEVLFELDHNESTGTQKLFGLSGPIFYALQTGGILAVDEIDASIHPNLMQAIVQLFHNPESNNKGAQLIISTHDTNLLTYGGYRRDQIYFTEKNQVEATDLYSLVEYRHENGTAARSDESFEKQYIKGRYGAIPFLGNVINLLADGETA